MGDTGFECTPTGRRMGEVDAILFPGTPGAGDPCVGAKRARCATAGLAGYRASAGAVRVRRCTRRPQTVETLLYATTVK